jgi:cation-transporting ATPase E
MDNKNGLTKAEVEKRISEGKTNHVNGTKTKTIKEIFTGNIFTYFNILNFLLALSLIISGIIFHDFWNSFKNSLFLGTAIANTTISIIQEILAKRTIDEMSVLSSVRAKVIRDGSEHDIDIEEIVMDDLISLELGSQIVCDSVIVSGNIEVNESFITGESKTIQKKVGDELLSGSFVVSGKCLARVTHVGNDNYINTLSTEAKKMDNVKSVIFNSFEKLVRILSYILVPLGVLLFVNQYVFVKVPIGEAIMNTVAALIGMIPEGLVLLTSSVMAVSVIKLSKQKVLVQQLYCIETLARVNCICLDKTGTITTGNMKMFKKLTRNNITEKDFDNALVNVVNALPDNSGTFNAVRSYVNKKIDIKADKIIGFSSERKYSACKIGVNCYYVGAPEYVLSFNPSLIDDEIKAYQEDYRVMVIAYRSGELLARPDDLQVMGYVLIEDEIRKEAKDTLEFFKEQGVKVKIISGDNYKTVMKIAGRVGLKNLKGVDATNLTDEELVSIAKDTDIFGRVTPHMKKSIIRALKKAGYIVAMTGDGVNDVLALKESDCAISIKSGTDAARNVAQLILLNDDFNSLPNVVAEGRQTINNVERSASLLLVKTLYTIFLILFSIIVSQKYFFIPIQLTFITAFTIGTPSFILALEPNNELVSGNFLLKVLAKALPTALTVVFNVALVTAFSELFELSYELQSTLSVYVTTITGLLYLYKICTPFTLLRGALFFTMLTGFTLGALVIPDFFNLLHINYTILLIVFVLSIDSLYIYKTLNYIISKIFNHFDKSVTVETDIYNIKEKKVEN